MNENSGVKKPCAPGGRCKNCTSERESCVSCKWRCQCGTPFTNRSTFRSHLSRSKNSSSNLNLAKKNGQTVLDLAMRLVQTGCKCENKCFHLWTINDLLSQLRPKFHLSPREKQIHLRELLGCIKTDSDNDEASKIGGRSEEEAFARRHSRDYVVYH